MFQLLNKLSVLPLGFSALAPNDAVNCQCHCSLGETHVWLSVGLFSFLSFSVWRHSSAPNHHTLVNSALRLRPATSADLDEITALGLASLHDDPVWPYRFSGATAHPDDHYKYSRIRFSEYLDNVEAGVYQEPKFTPLRGGRLGVRHPSDHPERRDANPARMLEFGKQLARAKAEGSTHDTGTRG